MTIVIFKSSSYGNLYFDTVEKSFYKTEFSPPETIAMKPPLFTAFITVFVLLVLLSDALSLSGFILVDVVFACLLFAIAFVNDRRLRKQAREGEKLDLSTMGINELIRLQRLAEAGTGALFTGLKNYRLGFFLVAALFFVLAFFMPDHALRLIGLGILELEMGIYISAYMSPLPRKNATDIMDSNVHRRLSSTPDRHVFELRCKLSFFPQEDATESYIRVRDASFLFPNGEYYIGFFSPEKADNRFVFNQEYEEQVFFPASVHQHFVDMLAESKTPLNFQLALGARIVGKGRVLNIPPQLTNFK